MFFYLFIFFFIRRQSDFYLYDTKTKTWTLICEDTSTENGPKLIFDHQMCMDIAKRNIYVFGGRILTPRKLDVLQCEPIRFSGLFVYNIPNNTWTQLMVDYKHPSAANPEVLSIKSRVTHSMLFHHVSAMPTICLLFFFNDNCSLMLIHSNQMHSIHAISIFFDSIFIALSKTVHIRRPTRQRIFNGLFNIRRRYAYSIIDNG